MNDFNLSGRSWPGLSKLIEECGEVVQVCGKLLGSNGVIHHWDGSNLKDRIEEELADLGAAIDFVVFWCNLSSEKIEKRRRVKLDKFQEWKRVGQ